MTVKSTVSIWLLLYFLFLSIITRLYLYPSLVTWPHHHSSVPPIPQTLISLTHFPPPVSRWYLCTVLSFLFLRTYPILFSSINISLSSTTRFNCTTLWILAEFVSTYFIHSPLIFSTLGTCINEHLPNLLDCELFKSRGYHVASFSWACLWPFLHLHLQNSYGSYHTVHLFSDSDIF